MNQTILLPRRLTAPLTTLASSPLLALLLAMLLALPLTGCPEPETPADSGVERDGGMDGGADAGADAGQDAGPLPDGGAPLCPSGGGGAPRWNAVAPGSLGGGAPAPCNVDAIGTYPGSNCNRGTCVGGMECHLSFDAPIANISSADGSEMANYQIHMYHDEFGMPLGGGHCGDFCDPEGPDPCGECGVCAGPPLQGRARLGWLRSDGRFDFEVGLCSFRCVPDPASNSGCRSGYTCDPFEGSCTSACVSDQQCQFENGTDERFLPTITYDGSSSPWRCNATTGLCEPGAPSGAVGDPCEADAECPAFAGRCLGGSCVQGGCGYEGGMECPAGSTCVAIPELGRSGSCVATCTSGDDCAPGNGCVPLEGGGGSVCAPVCDRDADCRGDERCDLSVSGDCSYGVCAPTCDLRDPLACGERALCVTATESLFCHALDGSCAADAACSGEQRCELWPAESAPEPTGMCQDPCAGDGDCGPEELCHAATGLCRLTDGPCTVMAECGRGQRCELHPGLTFGACVDP